jgi:hypothetical protein
MNKILVLAVVAVAAILLWQFGLAPMQMHHNTTTVSYVSFSDLTPGQLNALSPIIVESDWVIESILSGNGVWTVPENINKIDVLVVAGGGAGGGSGHSNPSANQAGGGGAGGLIWIQNVEKIGNTQIQPGNSIHYVVGAGGYGNPYSRAVGGSGGDSVFGNLTAKGGGGGGATFLNKHGNSGGSGGGGGGGSTPGSEGSGIQSSQSGWSGIYGYGNDGFFGQQNLGGGGGGSNSIGSPAFGGSGLDLSSYFGTTYGNNGVFASGGDATNIHPSFGNNNGNPNTGDGGSSNGGYGGSGVILIRYRSNQFLMNQPITYGFSTYEGSHEGTKLKKTENVLYSSIDVIVENRPFDLQTTVGTLDGVSLEAKVFSAAGTLIDTFFDVTPDISIPGLPYIPSGNIQITASKEGETQTTTVPFNMETLDLIVTKPSYYEYGHTVNLGVSFQQITDTAPVTVIIRDGVGSILEEYSGMMPQVQLSTPRALGHCTIETRVNYLGKLYTRTIDAYFTGTPLGTTVTTKSYVQYEMDSIEFEVLVKDVTGLGLTPASLSNIQPTASLSGGTVNSITYVHLGEGQYRVNADVTGKGNFLGRLEFTYMLQSFISDTIQINIGENKISVGTSDIPPTGTRGKTFTGFVDIFDAKSVRFEPDTIVVTVFYPDGYSKDTLFKNDLDLVQVGRYSFTYTPTQLEKYTFEVKATSAGITEGVSTASVIVGSAEGDADSGFSATGAILEFILNNLIIVLILFLVAALIIWRFLL